MTDEPRDEAGNTTADRELCRQADIALESTAWNLLWDYYVRASWYTSAKASKLIETRRHSFQTPRPA